MPREAQPGLTFPFFCHGGGSRDREALLLLVDHVAHRVHRLADAAPKPPFSFLDLAFSFEMAVTDRLSGLLLDRAGRLFQPALNSLPVHGVLQIYPTFKKVNRRPGGVVSGEHPA
jgi:hypothetical protein